MNPSALAEIIGQEMADEYGLPADLAVAVERPKSREHGDYATNVALTLAKSLGKSPREIAETLVRRLRSINGIANADVAGPGFVNIVLAAAAAGEIARTIVVAGATFGQSEVLAGTRINVEFISANPTGPLHLGHTRWAAVGDALARILSAAGASVAREFYINDRGVQMDRFGASIEAAACGLPTPEDGYHGAYIQDLAKQILKNQPEIMNLQGSQRTTAFREAGYQLQLAQQQKVLAEFDTHFDVWTSERALHEEQAVVRAFETLKNQGHVYVDEGATWLRTTDFSDDKDRVLLKADGTYTYFTSDTAYYISKRERGFDICIYLLGADHHGYIGRLKALAACNNDDPNYNVEVLIGQMVKIMEGGEEVKLSKRAGTIITLEELVEKVGVDAARYTLIRYPANTPMVMDVDVLRSRTNENPVYYVQYAHARICGVLRNASELGVNYGISHINSDQKSVV